MVLDTNVLIALLKGEVRVTRWFRALPAHQPLFISSVTRAELLAEPKSTPAQRQRIVAFLTAFQSVAFGDDSADTVATLRRRYPRLRLPDAAIAAAALMRGVSLATRDRAFVKVRELDVIVP